MARKFLTPIDMNSNAIQNLPAPSSSNDAARKVYVDDQVASVASGLNWKDSVRVATQANIDLSAPGATIDGSSMGVGNRFLVKAQTTASQNGIYIWSGASSAATRATDMDAAADVKAAVCYVEEGTDAGVTYRQSANVTNLGTDTVTFTAFNLAANASETVAGVAELATQAEADGGADDVRILTPLKAKSASWRSKGFSVDVGDNSATQIDVVHNLGTRDVIVQLRENASPYAYMDVDMQALDINTVRLIFAVAPTSNQYRCLVQKIVA